MAPQGYGHQRPVSFSKVNLIWTEEVFITLSFSSFTSGSTDGFHWLGRLSIPLFINIQNAMVDQGLDNFLCQRLLIESEGTKIANSLFPIHFLYYFSIGDLFLLHFIN